jgi:RsiW-degrading membrane proteinase PrsW (M82 family)
MREPLQPPFDKWQPWQRYVFGFAAMLGWLVLAGAAAIGLTVNLHLPACHALDADFFYSNCHTIKGVGVCVIALLILLGLYFKYFGLMCQLTYIRRNNYGVYEE